MASFNERAGACGWRGADVEEELRALARAVASEADALRANCEAVRVGIAQTRPIDGEQEVTMRLATNRAALLLAQIDDIEARKRAALEQEMVRVDMALELALSVSPDARTARIEGDGSSDASLAAHVDSLASALRGLPRLPVEPSGVRFVPFDGVDDPAAPQLGRLFAVRAARAADVVLTGPAFVVPGLPLRLALTLTPAFGSIDSDDLPATLAHLTRHAIYTLSLDGAAIAATLLQVMPDVAKRCIALSFELPAGIPHDLVLRASISVASAPVGGCLAIRTYRGLPPGLCIARSVDNDDEYSSPSISAATGVLYKVYNSRSSAHPDVQMFGRDGVLLPHHESLERHLRNNKVSSLTATRGPLGPMIIAVTREGSDFIVVAFDEVDVTATATAGAAPALLWERRFVDGGTGSGIAALPDHGVIVVGKCAPAGTGSLYVLDLASGEVRASVLARYAFFLAADAVSGTVMASVNEHGPFSNSFCVATFRWDGTSLLPQGCISDFFSNNAHITTTVVPSASPDSPAHLVACPRLGESLHVFVLPSLAPVLVHPLATGTKVVGLGSDPAGTTLIVCDEAAEAMTTLAWPLPGMTV